VPPKRSTLSELHGVTTHKTVLVKKKKPRPSLRLEAKKIISEKSGLQTQPSCYERWCRRSHDTFRTLAMRLEPLERGRHARHTAVRRAEFKADRLLSAASAISKRQSRCIRRNRLHTSVSPQLVKIVGGRGCKQAGNSHLAGPGRAD
jgi:hypothetical protein